MESQEDSIKERKDNLKSWIKDPYNLIFIFIILATIVIRLYYFFLTSSQPLWWDESDYMAFAKNLAGIHTYWTVAPQHNSLFPYIAAIFFKLGLSEAVIRFFLVLIPSILAVYLVYKICILMYKDKRIALISAFLMATFNETLFNSMRLHLESLALLTAFFAIYIFFQGYEKKQKILGKIDYKWAIPLTVFFVVLTYTLRRGYFLFGIFFLLYMLFSRKFTDLVKDKYNWFALLLALVLIFFSEKFIFTAPITEIAMTYYTGANFPFNLIPFNIFAVYFKSLIHPLLSSLFYLFWIGFAVIIFNLAVSLGYFKKPENSDLRSDLFSLITIAVTIAYFLFFMRLDPSTGIGDPRWHFSLLFGAFICISRGTLLITNFLGRYSKILSIFAIFLLIGYGGYYELSHADMIIKNKLTSYQGIKDASLYLKQVSNPDDIIVSVSKPQPAYYAERQTTSPDILTNKLSNFNTTLEEFVLALKENKRIRYVLVSFSEPNHPYWMKKEEYIQNPQTGQVTYSKWLIPFMNTTIDFVNNKQDIKQEVSYGGITFKLIKIFSEVFVYEVVRS